MDCVLVFVFPLLSQPPCAAGASCLQKRPSVFPCLAQGCWFRSTSHSSDTSGIVSCSQLVLCICSSRPAGFCERLSHRVAVKCAAPQDSFSKRRKVRQHKTAHYSLTWPEPAVRSGANTSLPHAGLIVESEAIIVCLSFPQLIKG